MFIRKVTKKNKKSDKSYDYYRLTNSYRVGNKTRQQVVHNLGTLDQLDKSKHKLLADRIEELLTGTASLFSSLDADVENLAQKFYKEIVKNGVFTLGKERKSVSEDVESDYVEVDVKSFEEIESRSVGGEWLAKQAFDALQVDQILSSLGMEQKDITIAKALLTAKMIHPSSELETERWLKENSATMELYGQKQDTASRYQLYKVAEILYQNKDIVEHKLYDICQNLFTQRNTVVIFDLSNTHFEGMMSSSKRAKFGRSKQKRNDCRLITLAISIDSLGFIRGCQFWDGNVSEPSTLKAMLDYIDHQYDKTKEKPLLIFDAGISIQDNLDMVAGHYDYVCVSRSIPKNFTKLAKNATELQDNRGNSIKVTKVETHNNETLLLIESQQKKKKEDAMEEKIFHRFEEALNYLKEGLNKPKRLKRIDKVHERVGRIKDQFSKVAKDFDITYKQNTEKDVITDITWQRRKSNKRPKGQYFLRYSIKELSESQIWDAYNLTREVEDCFKCLKSDLEIRPVFHQKDKYIETHIWLSILAYQVVNYIQLNLKEKNIHYRWKTILQKCETQRLTTTTVNAKNNQKLFVKTCTRPIDDLKAIYQSNSFKLQPFIRKTKVVTQ